jgi:hypothetical protein
MLMAPALARRPGAVLMILLRRAFGRLPVFHYGSQELAQ